MKLIELLRVSPFCEYVEINIREHGHGELIHKYHIGRGIRINRYVAERSNTKSVLVPNKKKVEIFDSYMKKPLTYINDSVSRTPTELMEMEVASILPRNLLILGEGVAEEIGFKSTATDNRFAYEINLFPEGYVVREVVPVPDKFEPDKNQMTFDEVLGNGKEV